jgi:hypothetical protein
MGLERGGLWVYTCIGTRIGGLPIPGGGRGVCAHTSYINVEARG